MESWVNVEEIESNDSMYRKQKCLMTDPSSADEQVSIGNVAYRRGFNAAERQSRSEGWGSRAGAGSSP